MLVTFSSFLRNQGTCLYRAKNMQEVFQVFFKELFKAFALVIAYLLHGLEENRITTKTPYWTFRLISNDPGLHPRSKQEATCLYIHSLPLVSTSVHRPGITLGNQMSPFVHMEGQTLLLSVPCVASIAVTRQQVNQNPTARAREVVPPLSCCPQYGS